MKNINLSTPYFIIGEPGVDKWFHKFSQRENGEFNEVACKELWSEESSNFNVLRAIHNGLRKYDGKTM